MGKISESKIFNKFLDKIKIIFIISTILFIIPSIIYFINNKTLLNFNGNLEFCFFLTNNVDRLYQAIAYTAIISIMVGSYALIIKYKEKIFKNIKQIFILIIVASSILIFTVPFMCSDVFYYLGIGRLYSKYHQNPYYTDMKTYIDENDVNIENDTLMQKGYKNYWANTTNVYGSVWTIICSIISFFSFGNLEVGIILFKIINLIIHILNCYLLYKISKKRIFPILYGLNPFILIEAIVNVHNDIYVVFFALLSIYYLIKKKNILLSLMYMSFATNIKYVTILFLPYIILYYVKNENIKNRVTKSIKYTAFFGLCIAIPCLLYFKDFQIFAGITAQNQRIAKGLYCFISEYFNNPKNIGNIINKTALCIFATIYFCRCVRLLFSKKIVFSKNMKEIYYLLIAFLFILLTNFQPWYFVWLSAVIMWQSGKNIKLITQMQILTLYANIVFLIYSEYYKYGVPFFAIYVISILVCIIKNNKNKTIYIRRKNLE